MKSPPWQEGQECPMAEGGCITAATTLRGCETEPNWAWQKQHKKFIAATVRAKDPLSQRGGSSHSLTPLILQPWKMKYITQAGQQS